MFVVLGQHQGNASMIGVGVPRMTWLVEAEKGISDEDAVCYKRAARMLLRHTLTEWGREIRRHQGDQRSWICETCETRKVEIHNNNNQAERHH